MTREPDHWTLDKKIPAALIFALVAQFAGIMWYVGKLDNRIGQIEVIQAKREADGDRLTRLEEKLIAMQATLIRIEAVVGRSASAQIEKPRI